MCANSRVAKYNKPLLPSFCHIPQNSKKMEVETVAVWNVLFILMGKATVTVAAEIKDDENQEENGETGDNGTDETEQQGERDYSVEKIVKKRIVGVHSVLDQPDIFSQDRVQYFLKWVGYSDAENTWEDEENLVGCQKLLQEFHSLEKKEGQGQKRKAEEEPV